MKKNIKKAVTGLMVAALLTGTTTVWASEQSANDQVAPTSSTVVSKTYSLEEMLTLALQDEYNAQAEYAGIMDSLGVQRPFSNIIRSEANHIQWLLPLFEKYDITVPENTANDHVVIPATLTEAYAIGVEAEIKNITMYESFLAQDLPEDVAVVFEYLAKASETHQATFERSETKVVGQGKMNTTDTTVVRGNNNGQGSKNQGGKGQGQGQGQSQSQGAGRGNGGQSNYGTNNCIIE